MNRPIRRPGAATGEPGLPVRRQAVQRRDGRYGRGRNWRPDISRALTALLFVVVLGGTVGFVAAALGPDPSPSPTRPGVAGSPGSGASPGADATATPSSLTSGNVLPSLPSESTEPTESPGPSTSPGASPSPSPSSSPAATTQEGAMPVVPVLGFWSSRSSITSADLAAALKGSSSKFADVIVSAEDRDAISATLGLKIGESVRSGTVEEIRSAVRQGALGFLRAADVTPAVHALGIDDRQLFGDQRVAEVADWPLLVTVLEPPDRTWDQGATWTIAAAGDIVLDRGPARQVTILKKGVDFPYDGGTVDITGSRCCSGRGHPVPTYRRTGNSGAVRSLMGGADLAMVDLESPIDDQWRYHEAGEVFTGNPKLLEGLKNAGIDYASLANDHIGNAGPDGILETYAELDRLGIRHAGAGKDLKTALIPASFEIRGVRIAVIGCDAIASAYWAKADKIGSNPCQAKTMVPAIKAARATHDLVIIYPHWGIEFRTAPSAYQRENARKWIDAGADLILGNHPHWVEAMEEIDGKLVFYALGNFVFDQMSEENTMEGLIVEISYSGTTLRQVRLHPTLVIDQAQPNLLDPTDGQRVIKRIRDASKDLLPY